MTEPAWETTKKSYCCLCFSDLILNFQSYASANFSVPPLSFHSLCFPFPNFFAIMPHRRSSHSPVVVDVGGRHRVAEVGAHLERITNKTRLAFNHTTMHRSLSFLSFSFFTAIFSCVPFTTAPRSFPLQSLNPTIPWGLPFHGAQR